MSAETESAVARAPEAWNPRFHVIGDRNWINDPNGPIQHRGVHHLFYQANPKEPFWGPPAWGHVTSTDLVTWTRHPPALRPGPGTADADGCWSGCTRIVDGRPAIYYTGVVGEDDQRVESVCRAWGSEDLLRWEKDPANPLIAGPPDSGSGLHRDPFLWQDADGWHMLLGSGTSRGERHGQIVRYDSVDATDWRYGGVFFEAPRFEGGLDLGEHWECPQLLLDGDAAALILSCQAPMSVRPLMHAVTFCGALREGRFEGGLAGRLDFGDVFYAPALSRDEAGRDLLWGWAQERLGLDAQGALSHAGALTLPRQATLRRGTLVLRPVPELDGLRAGPLAPAGPPRGGMVAEPQMELVAVLEGTGGAGGWALSCDDPADLRVEVLVDFDDHRLRIAVADGTGERRSLEAPLERRERHALRVFVDGSLLEVFADDGDAALTTRSYPAPGSWSRVELVRSGRVQATEAGTWRARAELLAAG